MYYLVPGRWAYNQRGGGGLFPEFYGILTNSCHYFDLVLFIAYFRWVTMNDSLACEEPCFFCATCFKGLHYSPNGEKICDFQAYPIVGDFDW